jgi:hypothetical protein
MATVYAMQPRDEDGRAKNKSLDENEKMSLKRSLQQALKLKPKDKDKDKDKEEKDMLKPNPGKPLVDTSFCIIMECNGSKYSIAVPTGQSPNRSSFSKRQCILEGR